MKIKVKGSTVGMPCDQFAEVIEVNCTGIHIRLLGTGAVHTIPPTAILGLSLSDNLFIDFDVTCTMHLSNG